MTLLRDGRTVPDHFGDASAAQQADTSGAQWKRIAQMQQTQDLMTQDADATKVRVVVPDWMSRVRRKLGTVTGHLQRT